MLCNPRIIQPKILEGILVQGGKRDSETLHESNVTKSGGKVYHNISRLWFNSDLIEQGNGIQRESCTKNKQVRLVQDGPC